MPLICIDCRYIKRQPSGIARVVQALVDLVPGMAPELEFLFLKHPDAPTRLSDAANVREIVVAAPANSPTTMWWLPRAVDLSGVDLFHATFNIMPAGLPMPCVTTIHDIMWLTHPQWCNARWSRQLEGRFYQHGIRRALARSAAIVTVSEASRQTIVRYAPDAAPRTHVTPLGVAPVFRPGAFAPQALADLGLPVGKRFVLTVGQYVPYKNHEGAARIFARIAGEHPDVELVFVQRLSRRSDALKRLARNLGIGERVHFLPSIAEHQMVELYCAAVALLHPSLCEGFGLPLAEAMASGCPVVTSDRSAMAEVVGDAGLLADPLDEAAMAAALRKILGGRAAAKDLRSCGLQRSAGMEWQRFAAANLAIYRKLIQPEATLLHSSPHWPTPLNLACASSSPPERAF